MLLWVKSVVHIKRKKTMWLYKDREFTEDMIQSYTGFVYIIKNLKTGRCYIGQKNLWSTKTRTVKGKKKRTKVISDYMNYWGSNEELKLHIQQIGIEHFTREIIHLCLNKGTQNYLELREQMDARVLEKQDEWYNGFVGGKIHRSHVKL